MRHILNHMFGWSRDPRMATSLAPTMATLTAPAGQEIYNATHSVSPCLVISEKSAAPPRRHARDGMRKDTYFYSADPKLIQL